MEKAEANTVSLDLPSAPDDVPPSAQTVYETLALEGPLTHKELVEVTGMPPRTVRYAVSRLEDEGHLGRRLNLMDSRQQFFFLSDEDDATTRRRPL